MSNLPVEHSARAANVQSEVSDICSAATNEARALLSDRLITNSLSSYDELGTKQRNNKAKSHMFGRFQPRHCRRV